MFSDTDNRQKLIIIGVSVIVTLSVAYALLKESPKPLKPSEAREKREKQEEKTQVID